MSNGNPALLHARRIEDASVQEWQTKKGSLRQLFISPLGIGSAVIFLSIGFLAGILPNLNAIKDGTLATHDAIRMTIGLVFTVSCAIGFPFIASPGNDQAIAGMLKAKKGVHKSRTTAKKLGSTVVPALTVEHIEARIRVDESLTLKRKELGKPATDRTNSNAIAAMLFQNLNREEIILSLINDRGLIIAADISETLQDIETHHSALWDGAL